MADSFDQAAGDAEKRRKEALEALANGGTAGLEAYKQAQGQIQSVQSTALNQALNAAAGRGASGAAQGALETMIRQPGDLALQQLAGSQAAFSADMARRTAANDDYFTQVGQAVPAARTYAQGLWAAQQAKEAASKAKEAEDALWKQRAITAGLAEMQAEAERQRRFNDLQEQQARVAAPGQNPTFDPVGAALLLGSGQAPPAEQAQAREILANPSAGATYFTPGGAEVEMSPQVADPHYMGRMLPEAAADIADEIARSRVPENVQAQREAYLQVYGDDPRNQALARGIFQPPVLGSQLTDLSNQQRASFYDAYGALPTPTQAQRFALGEDPFADDNERRVLTAEEAAQAAGIDPREVDTARSKPAFNAALIAYEEGRKSGASLAEIDRILQETLEEEYGHDYPKIRALVSAMFAPAYRG